MLVCLVFGRLRRTMDAFSLFSFRTRSRKVASRRPGKDLDGMDAVCFFTSLQSHFVVTTATCSPSFLSADIRSHPDDSTWNKTRFQVVWRIAAMKAERGSPE